jgi:hypothetical protein
LLAVALATAAFVAGPLAREQPQVRAFDHPLLFMGLAVVSAGFSAAVWIKSARRGAVLWGLVSSLSC